MTTKEQYKAVTDNAVKRIEEAISFLGIKVKVEVRDADKEDSFIELSHEGKDGKLYGTGLELFISWDYRKNIAKEKIGEPVPFYTVTITTPIPGTHWEPPDADVEDLCESTTRLEYAIPVLLGKFVEYELSVKYDIEAEAAVAAALVETF
jgi:hypothetical protein